MPAGLFLGKQVGIVTGAQAQVWYDAVIIGGGHNGLVAAAYLGSQAEAVYAHLGWQRAGELVPPFEVFEAVSAGTVQVCTAAMTYGFRIVEEMKSGLARWMDEKGYRTIDDFRGRAVGNVTDWQFLNLNAVSKAQIDQDKCISCGRCHIACEDTSHQAITAVKDGKRHFEVLENECVGCNLCVTVCPVPECITLRTLAPGEVDARTGQTVSATAANWTTHPNNPMRKAAEPA